MNAATIEFHAKTIAAQTKEMITAEADGDKMTAEMLAEAIRFRKAILVQRGVVII